MNKTEKEILKKAFIVSIVSSSIISFLICYWFYWGASKFIWLFLSGIFMSFTFLWLISTVVFYYLEKKDILKCKLITMLATFFIMALIIHSTFIQPKIEREEPFFNEIGCLNTSLPTLKNGTYTQIINFSLHNKEWLNIQYLEFNIIFKDNLIVTPVSYYPKKDNIKNISNNYEIIYRWKDIEKGEKAYINFAVNWSNITGNNYFFPISEYYMRVGVGRNEIKIVRC